VHRASEESAHSSAFSSSPPQQSGVDRSTPAEAEERAIAAKEPLECGSIIAAATVTWPCQRRWPRRLQCPLWI